MLRYRITTLGCRVNHAESREIESVLQARGLSPAPPDEPTDLEVIHTCSVTNTAAAKSRHALRRALRRQSAHTDTTHDAGGSYPQNRNLYTNLPRVLVTGCYTGTNHAEAVQIAGDPAAVIPHHHEDGSTMIGRLARQIDAWLHLQGRQPHAASSGKPIRTPAETSFNGSARSETPIIHRLPVIEPPHRQARHIRAEIRIQDGCDAHCTFCIIPRIRKTLRSKTVADVVAEARMLVDAGHKEIVLAGVFIGAYGHETALRRKQANRFASPLADLLDSVAQVPGVERLRISSMEPGDVDEPLLDAMLANHPVVVPHLHLPLQSGSDAVLKKMNRQYRVGDYMDMIEQVNQALTHITPDGAFLPPAITTDIICGFPGETDADFEQTVAVARRVGYLHMHVFPYSPRQGTAAARWSDMQVPDATKKARVRTLIDLEEDPAEGLSIRYRESFRGQAVRIILEQPAADHPGFWSARTDHYFPVLVQSNSPRGTLMEVSVTDILPETTLAEALPTRVGLPVLAAT